MRAERQTTPQGRKPGLLGGIPCPVLLGTRPNGTGGSDDLTACGNNKWKLFQMYHIFRPALHRVSWLLERQLVKHGEEEREIQYPAGKKQGGINTSCFFMSIAMAMIHELACSPR